jgi:cobalt-zinc-cadmium efflux system outer membrane protein
LTVEEAVAEAMQNNLSLLAERASIPIAEARVLTARLRPNPVVSAAGDHLDVLGTGFNDVNAGGPSEIVVGSEFLIERGGKRRRRTDVAEQARSVAETAFLDAVRLTRLEVQNAFVDVLLARDNLALVRDNLDALNRIVETNAARLRAGDIAEVELIRSRVAALQYSNAARQAEAALRQAYARLATLLGRSPDRPPMEAAGELRRGPVLPGLEELKAAALQSRPDLQALRLEEGRAEAEIRLQESQAKPDFTVGVEYRRQQVNASSNSLTLSFSAPLPLFDRNQGEIARARAERRQAALRSRAREAEIAGEVAAAYQQYLVARDVVESIEARLLAEARDIHEITAFAYRNGDATLLEFLDAQRAFNDTMQAYNDGRAEYARSLYRLEAVCGKAVTQ